MNFKLNERFHKWIKYVQVMVYIYFAVTSVFYILYFAWKHNKTEDKFKNWTVNISS